jgi:hypothetical protein
MSEMDVPALTIVGVEGLFGCIALFGCILPIAQVCTALNIPVQLNPLQRSGQHVSNGLDARSIVMLPSILFGHHHKCVLLVAVSAGPGRRRGARGQHRVVAHDHPRSGGCRELHASHAVSQAAHAAPAAACPLRLQGSRSTYIVPACCSACD